MNIDIKQIIENSISVKKTIFDNEELVTKIADVVKIIIAAFENGNKVLFCGNGGSAADAQHLAAEFSGRFYIDRKALPAEALHCNTSYLTAVGNDYGYQYVYARIIDGVAKQGDVLIGLSTSGNSENIVNAFNSANKLGVRTIALTGATGGKMKDISECLINVPSNDTPRIQEAHIMIGHIICQLVEANIFGNDK
jgi:D-sedoheptulose 7-phosphate isomerase